MDWEANISVLNVGILIQDLAGVCLLDQPID